MLPWKPAGAFAFAEIQKKRILRRITCIRIPTGLHAAGYFAESPDGGILHDVCDFPEINYVNSDDKWVIETRQGQIDVTGVRRDACRHNHSPFIPEVTERTYRIRMRSLPISILRHSSMRERPIPIMKPRSSRGP